MKIEPIDERLLRAVSHVCNYAREKYDKEHPDGDYDYVEGLKESLELVNEYVGCFNALGEVSQQGEVPHCWNEDTIFEPHHKVGTVSYATEEASPEQKDANAKKILEELT